MFTAEDGQFTGEHGISHERRLESAAIYSELWGGKPVKRLRALDGATALYGRRKPDSAYARGDLFTNHRALMEDWVQVATGIQDKAAVAVGQD